MASVRYFAAAADAAGVASETRAAGTLGELLQEATRDHGERFASVLGRCTTLVDGMASSDPTTPLRADSLVDVLPPFAGG